MKTQSPEPDPFFSAIVGLIVAIVIWLILTPIVPQVAAASMHRFHLRSRSFAVWAIQFPIPTMYNFANRFEVREIPLGLIDPIADETEKRYINHFPSRVLTFFNTRQRYLGDGKDRWVTIDTTYRGQTIETRMHASPKEGGQGFDLLRLDSGALNHE